MQGQNTIEVHYHYVCEKVLVGHVYLVYVSIEEQVADIFTKCLGAKKLNKFRSMMGVQGYGLSLRGSVEISSSSYDSTRVMSHLHRHTPA